ncbi:hypothetical protein FJZ48_04500 [Candidatus Uhrbacteria bacterium]|nr:hypothetical protein [Candidatus Uhrbacteria bacterium]
MRTVPLLTMKPETVSEDLWRCPELRQYLIRDDISIGEIIPWDGTIMDIPPSPRILILVSENMICLPGDLGRFAEALEHVAFMSDQLLLPSGRFALDKGRLHRAVARLVYRTYPDFDF